MAAHAVLLAAIGAGTPASTPAIALDPAARAGFPLEPAALVDLAALEDAAVLAAVAAVATPSAPDLSPLPLIRADDRRAFPADEPRRDLVSVRAPRAGARDTHVPPAPDTGEGAGRRPDDLAWRRDSSTLHERLTDGAERYQPAHTRTTWAAAPLSSPEALRREPLVGEGDSARSKLARGSAVAPSPERPAIDDPSPAAASSDPPQEPGALSTVAPRPPVSIEEPQAPGLVTSPAQGPVDAERGSRAFDVSLGEVVRDDQSRRAASAERHPSITDLTLAASEGDDAHGHGPSSLPGAVARPSAATGAASPGFGGPRDGAGDAARTRERLYARYELDIRARVNGVLGRVWPRRLALRLEQGETMVAFVVLPDGRLAGPVRVTKSAGFEEFDRAALEAIRLVIPFPPIPRAAGVNRASPLPIFLRVTFSNPVIR